MATGKITQIIGAVIDVEFPRESIPQVYEALKLDDADLTLEVQQQLGDGVVRTIAMGSSEGLKRGLTVKPTGKPISVPKTAEQRMAQRALLQFRHPKNRRMVSLALRKAGRTDLIGFGPKCLLRPERPVAKATTAVTPPNKRRRK